MPSNWKKRIIIFKVIKYPHEFYVFIEKVFTSSILYTIIYAYTMYIIQILQIGEREIYLD